MGFEADSDSGTGAVASVLLRSLGFARGGVWDRCAPSAALALALEEAAGPDLSCPGATPDERVGWHRWQTPAGRVYVQGPKRYPA